MKKIKQFIAINYIRLFADKKSLVIKWELIRIIPIFYEQNAISLKGLGIVKINAKKEKDTIFVDIVTTSPGNVIGRSAWLVNRLSGYLQKHFDCKVKINVSQQDIFADILTKNEITYLNKKLG